MHGSTSRESPTDFLIRTLESIEGAEDVVIVFRKSVNGIDHIDWKANEVPLWKIMGMLQYVQHDMHHTVLEDDDATD